MAHLGWSEEAFILCRVPAFILPLVDETLGLKRSPKVRHRQPVPLLCSPNIVCVGDITAPKEVFESLGHLRA